MITKQRVKKLEAKSPDRGQVLFVYYPEHDGRQLGNQPPKLVGYRMSLSGGDEFLALAEDETPSGLYRRMVERVRSITGSAHPIGLNGAV